jgi:hypothetical protein
MLSASGRPRGVYLPSTGKFREIGGNMKLKLLRGSILLAVLAFPCFAQNQAARILGTIDSFNGQMLSVKSQDGQVVSIAVPPDLKVMANAKASLADIKPGDFVGSAADKGPDGKLHAEEVHIFPEAMRGTGEGHRPMGPDPNRTMTNGTVTMAGPEDRTMTNGTVSGVSGGSSRTMALKYKDGEQVIEVAPDTPIVIRVLGDRSLLKPGAVVLVLAVQKDGALVATGLTAEKDGVKPR